MIRKKKKSFPLSSFYWMREGISSLRPCSSLLQCFCANKLQQAYLVQLLPLSTDLLLTNTTTLKTTMRIRSSAPSKKITACGSAPPCQSCSRKEACSATWTCTPTSPTTPRASTGTSTTTTAPMVWSTPSRGRSTLTTSSTPGLQSFR